MKFTSFQNWLNENVTSTTGNNVTTYFETGQGSKYLLTDKGETKRFKSAHANTGGEDQGLKEWFQKSFFVDPKFEYEANSIQFLIDKGFKNIGLSKKDNKITIYILKDNKWVIGNWTDAYPNAKKEKPLIFEYIETPKIGFNVAECIFKEDKFSIKNYHFGSEITKILPIDKVDEKTINLFKNIKKQ
jgi:hypothetical protein